VKGRTVSITGEAKGKARLKLGLGLIHCGCWLCRSYRIDVSLNGVKTRTIRPHAKLTISLRDV